MSVEIVVKPDIELGTWQGMGGAITEATAYNFAKLSPSKQRKLLDVYYGKDGLDYRWGRISIGSNDFCLEPYEYTKKQNLSDFSIEHDRKWLLPMLKQILQKKSLQLVASPWSPPSCLKTTHMTRFGGTLKPWRYGRYAKYIRKWLDAYADEGIFIKYITPQNEPRAIQKWESCLYSFRCQRKLAYKYLAKELEDFDTQILMWDHNKEDLDRVADKLLKGRHDDKVAGICFHWYDGTWPDKIWTVRQKYPDIMLVSSEMCCGWSPYSEDAWQGAAKAYCYELLSDINCGASAWIDWNMLLSSEGGPSYCKNYVTSPVILNEADDDYILTPIYMALKKFNALFPAGSKVIHCENSSSDVVAVARKVKSGYEVVVVNVAEDNAAQEILIKVGEIEKRITLECCEPKKYHIMV